MKYRSLILFSALMVVLAACGGGSDSATDEPTASTDARADDDAGGSSDDSVGSVSGGDDGWFDASALGGSALDLVHLRPLDRSIDVFAPAVDPVVDTCAALPAAAVTAVADEADAAFFGREHAFESSSIGAACDYAYDGHLIRVIIGSADQVDGSVDSPAMTLPAGAGEVTMAASPDGDSVMILSEDSFDLDTPFGALAMTDTANVLVLNRGGTGIDYNVDGLVFSRIAAAAAEGLAGAPAPSADALAQMEVIAADPCSIWTIDELDAFMGAEAITRVSDAQVTDGCQWTSEESISQVRIMALPLGTVADGAYAPVSDGSPVNVNAINGRVLLITADFAVEIAAAGPTGDDGVANVALAENILSRVAS